MYIPKDPLIEIRNRQTINQPHPPPQLLQRLFRLEFPQLPRLPFRHEDKVMAQRQRALLDAILLRRLRVRRVEVDDERFLHAEDRVRCHVWISSQVKCPG